MGRHILSSKYLAYTWYFGTCIYLSWTYLWPSINVVTISIVCFAKCCCLDYAVSGNVIFPNNQSPIGEQDRSFLTAALHSFQIICSFGDGLSHPLRWERKAAFSCYLGKNNWQECRMSAVQGNKLYFHLRRYVPSNTRKSKGNKWNEVKAGVVSMHGQCTSNYLHMFDTESMTVECWIHLQEVLSPNLQFCPG